jgi:hypothetical protein
MIAVFHIIKYKEPYEELGGDYLLKLRPHNVAKSMIRRLKSLGYEVIDKKSV